MKCLWYRIIAASTPRVAAQKSPYRKVRPLDGAVSAESLDGILRAGGCEPAGWRFERTDADLVEPYQENEGRNGDLSDNSSDPICVHYR